MNKDSAVKHDQLEEQLFSDMQTDTGSDMSSGQTDMDDPDIYRMKQAWEQMVIHGLPPSYTVRPEILCSWERCRKMGLDPFRPTITPRLDAQALNQRLIENRALIEVANPIMTMIDFSTRGTGFITSLADKDGYVLALAGDSATMDRARNNGYLPGSSRNEKDAGTNAIALAALENLPIQLTGAEHYNKHHQYWTCSSAPIHDNQNNILGVITLSGPYRGYHKHTLAIAASAARNIEGHLREFYLVEEKHRLNCLLTSIVDSVSEGIIAVEENLTVSRINRQGAEMLGLDPRRAIGSPLERVIDAEQMILNALKNKNYFSNREVNFKCPTETRSYICSLQPIIENGLPNKGALITIAEKKHMIRIVKQLAGNSAKFEFDDIKGNNKELLSQIEIAKIAAKSSSKILISGESGTGKEMFVQAIHNHSNRGKGPFVAISCAAIPRDLIEAELFGYRDGAFTGARKTGQVGKFELAHMGTLFLDEINGMPLDLQAKLLRVLQQNEIVRLGDNQVIPVNVNVVAACNTDLMQEVNCGNFREDLYYRLNVVEINLPPLRERLEDLELLIDHFVSRYCREKGCPRPVIRDEVMQALRKHTWPGNIRELGNCIERALLLAQDGEVTLKQLPERMLRKHTEPKVEAGPVKELLKKMVEEALAQNNGNISLTAKQLQISRGTLYRRMKEFNIQDSDLMNS